MGLVYDGHDPKLNRRVAIKTILTRTLDEATARHYSMRFKREVRAVARLNHPNIVQVYDFGNEGDLAYIVMEYIQGKELKDALGANERFDLGTILRLMIELLDALECAHQAGVIHRDIKPANVMVDAGGHAKLTDFGVARFTEPDREQAEATRAGQIIGTPSYMSPEQIQGQAIDRRTDLFSAGVLFYQFLTGQKPFEGTQWALAKKISRTIRSGRRRWCRFRSRPSRKASRWKSTAQSTKPKWNSGKRSRTATTPEDLALYVEQFPNGAFAPLARKRIAKLHGKED